MFTTKIGTFASKRIKFLSSSTLHSNYILKKSSFQQYTSLFPHLHTKSTYKCFLPVPTLLAVSGLHRQNTKIFHNPISPEEALDAALYDEASNRAKTQISSAALLSSEENLFLELATGSSSQFPTNTPVPLQRMSPSTQIQSTSSSSKPTIRKQLEQSLTERQALSLEATLYHQQLLRRQHDQLPLDTSFDDHSHDESEEIVGQTINNDELSMQNEFDSANFFQQQQKKRQHHQHHQHQQQPQIDSRTLKHLFPLFLRFLFQKTSEVEVEVEDYLIPEELNDPLVVLLNDIDNKLFLLESANSLIDLIPDPESLDMNDPKDLLQYKQHVLSSMQSQLGEIFEHFFPPSYFSPVKILSQGIFQLLSAWSLYMLSPYIAFTLTELVTHDTELATSINDTLSHIIYRHGTSVAIGLGIGCWLYFGEFLFRSAISLYQLMYRNSNNFSHFTDHIVQSQIDFWILINPNLQTIDLKTGKPNLSGTYDLIQLTPYGNIILTSPDGSVVSDSPDRQNFDDEDQFFDAVAYDRELPSFAAMHDPEDHEIPFNSFPPIPSEFGDFNDDMINDINQANAEDFPNQQNDDFNVGLDQLENQSELDDLDDLDDLDHLGDLDHLDDLDDFHSDEEEALDIDFLGVSKFIPHREFSPFMFKMLQHNSNLQHSIFDWVVHVREVKNEAIFDSI